MENIINLTTASGKVLVLRNQSNAQMDAVTQNFDLEGVSFQRRQTVWYYTQKSVTGQNYGAQTYV